MSTFMSLPMSTVWALVGSATAGIAATLLVPIGEQRIARWSTIVAGVLGAVISMAHAVPSTTLPATPWLRALWTPMGGEAGLGVALLGDAPSFLALALCSAMMVAACMAGASESSSHEPTRVRCSRVALPLLQLGLTLWILAGSLLTQYIGGQLIVLAMLAALGGSDDAVSRGSIIGRGVTAQLGLSLWAAAGLVALSDRDVALRSTGSDSLIELGVALSPAGTQILLAALLMVAAFLWAGLPPFAAWARRMDSGRGSGVIVVGLASGVPALDMMFSASKVAPTAHGLYFDPVAWLIVGTIVWLGLAARVREDVACRAQTLSLVWLLFSAALIHFESPHAILLAPFIVLGAVASAGAATIAGADLAVGAAARSENDVSVMRLMSSLHWAALAGLPGLAVGTWACLGILGAIEGQAASGRELHIVLLLAAMWPASGAAAATLRGAFKADRPRVSSRREELLRRHAPLRSRSGSWLAILLLTALAIIGGLWTTPLFSRGFLQAEVLAEELAWRHCMADLLRDIDRPVVPSRSTITECGPAPQRLDPDAPVKQAPAVGETDEDAESDAAARAVVAEVDALIEQAQVAAEAEDEDEP